MEYMELQLTTKLFIDLPSFIIVKVCEKLMCPDLCFLIIWHAKAYI